jgi:hypothetical protein
MGNACTFCGQRLRVASHEVTSSRHGASMAGMEELSLALTGPLATSVDATMAKLGPSCFMLLCETDTMW